MSLEPYKCCLQAAELFSRGKARSGLHQHQQESPACRNFHLYRFKSVEVKLRFGLLRKMAHHGDSNASIALVNAHSKARIGRELHGTGLKTAQSWEVLVKTGLGVKGMEVGRTFYLWPGQRVSAVNMKPRNISFNLHRQANCSLLMLFLPYFRQSAHAYVFARPCPLGTCLKCAWSARGTEAIRSLSPESSLIYNPLAAAALLTHAIFLCLCCPTAAIRATRMQPKM